LVRINQSLPIDILFGFCSFIKVKKEYLKFLIRFFVLFIVVELMIMMNFIIFSDNPLTWDEFLRDVPFVLIICLGVVFLRGLEFMVPTNKKD